MLRTTLMGIAALGLVSAQAVQSAPIKASNAVVAWHKVKPVDRDSAPLANPNGLAAGIPAWLIILLIAGGTAAAGEGLGWFKHHRHSPF